MNWDYRLGNRFSGRMLISIMLMGLAQSCADVQFPKFDRPLSDPISTPVGVSIEAEQFTSPIKTHQTFIATVKDAQGKPVYNTAVEWILARASNAVGDIIEVRQDPLKRALKISNTYARGGTNRRGESAITITSAQEGTTHLIAVVPAIKDKSQYSSFAVMHWWDAKWEFPNDSAQKVGTSRTLTTTIRKASTNAPLTGYQVKWNVTSGPKAYFDESGNAEAITKTDENGIARVTLSQLAPGPGANTVYIDVIKPEKAGGECCPTVSDVIANGVSITTWMIPSITLKQQCPSALVLGNTEEFPITLTNTSQVDATNIRLKTIIPEGMEFAEASPQAQLSRNTLAWDLMDLPAQTSRQIIIRMKAGVSGIHVHKAFVQADDGVQNQSMCSVSVGKPILSVSQTCPSKILVGDKFEFGISVTNTGTAEASNVQITDDVPSGMSHASGQSEVTRDTGVLPAGSTVTEVFTFKADQTGFATNVARVTGGTNLSKQTSCALSIKKSSIAITQTGPENRFLGTTATYTIEVSNPGSAPATGVVVQESLPSGFTYESANPPGNHFPNTNDVSWNLGTLAPRETKTFQVIGRAVSEGKQCNLATVQTERGLQENAEVCTIVKGVATLLLDITDKPGLVEVGTQTTYSIVVTNQGTANATNIKVTATIPDGMKYISSTGSTGRLVVVGKLVDFDPIPALKPKKNLMYTVTVEGMEPGDHRFRVEVNADQLTNPVLEEENTKLYR